MISSVLIAALAATQTPTLPAFLTGCWDLFEGDHWTQECWMEPKAGLMLGASREGNGDKLSSWEQMRIERAPDGTITLYASPGGHNVVPFKASQTAANAIEFTSAAHDYPQRLRYKLKNGRLSAEISLLDGSKPTRWAYKLEGN
jgi:hypothetical protein